MKGTAPTPSSTACTCHVTRQISHSLRHAPRPPPFPRAHVPPTPLSQAKPPAPHPSPKQPSSAAQRAVTNGSGVAGARDSARKAPVAADLSATPVPPPPATNYPPPPADLEYCAAARGGAAAADPPRHLHCESVTTSAVDAVPLQTHPRAGLLPPPVQVCVRAGQGWWGCDAARPDPRAAGHRWWGSPAAQRRCWSAPGGSSAQWATAGARVEQGPWASRTRKRSKAGCGRPEDGGVGSTKTVKRPPQQPAQPPVRQLLGAADTQTAHPATSSTAPVHQRLGSANAETTPAGAPAAAAVRTQRRDATCGGKSG